MAAAMSKHIGLVDHSAGRPPRRVARSAPLPGLVLISVLTVVTHEYIHTVNAWSNLQSHRSFDRKEGFAHAEAGTAALPFTSSLPGGAEPSNIISMARGKERRPCETCSSIRSLPRQMSRSVFHRKAGSFPGR
jgi:hypothetical protein